MRNKSFRSLDDIRRCSWENEIPKIVEAPSVLEIEGDIEYFKVLLAKALGLSGMVKAMTDCKRYLVFKEDGDISILDKYVVGQKGVIRRQVLTKDGMFRVIAIIDEQAAMN